MIHLECVVVHCVGKNLDDENYDRMMATWSSGKELEFYRAELYTHVLPKIIEIAVHSFMMGENIVYVVRKA